MLPTIDYRTPTTRPPRVQIVIDRLMVADSADWLLIATKVLFGLPLCFLLPFLVVVIPRRSRFPFLSFETFALLSICVIPVLFWIVLYKDRPFIWEALEEADPPTYRFRDGAFQYIYGDIFLSFWLELLLTGPRLLVNAIRDLDRRDRSDEVLRALAAKVVVELYDSPQSVPLWRLVTEDRSANEVRKVIEYLHHRHWIGLPARRDRVWLSSSLRRELAALW